MIYKIIILINLFLTSFASHAFEISVTNPLVKSEIDFYSQSSSGSLITCGVKFNGLDHELNFFTGSYSLMYFKDKRIVPMLKIVSAKIDLNGTSKTNPIKKAWIQTEGKPAIGNNWIGRYSNDSFLMLAKSEKAFEEGANLYADITSGLNIKIGYLHENGSIDRVYLLKKYIPKKELTALSCLTKMIDQLSVK